MTHNIMIPCNFTSVSRSRHTAFDKLLITQILKDFNQTYIIFPLLSEDGIRKMVIVVAVTSSSFTRRGGGGGGAENKIFTRNNNSTLVCMRVKRKKSEYEPSGPLIRLERIPVPVV